jgi:hypothetical protein
LFQVKKIGFCKPIHHLLMKNWWQWTWENKFEENMRKWNITKRIDRIHKFEVVKLWGV